MVRRIWLLFALFCIVGCDGCFGCGDGDNPSLDELVIETCDNEEDDNGDGLTDCEDARCQLTEACAFEPADPGETATDLTPDTSFYDSVRFLWEGEAPVVRGVDPDQLDERRIIVLRARVTDRDGEPIAGARAYVTGNPGFGYTYSRADGRIDLVANGGGQVTVRVQGEGLLPVDRTTDNAPVLDYVPVDRMVVTQLDPRSKKLSGGGSLVASTESDDDGERAARIWFPDDTVATAHLPDGQRGDITDFTVRLTEYTVGNSGPDAMPAFLPEESGYTYAVEMSIDEAEAMGADEVTFDKTAYLYLDNFLEFPVGSTVPSGYYSRSRRQWEPTPDGQVVARVSGGLDIDGSGAAASDDQLAAIGLTGAEADAIEGLFDVGEDFWRAPVNHFSPQDLNWPYELPPDAVDPSEIPDFPNTRDDDPCTEGGSIIECQNRVLIKTLPVPGTGMSLVYRSDRTEGRGRAFSLALTNDSPPESLKEIRVRIKVAGHDIEETLEVEPNLVYDYEWDGFDAYGRKVERAIPVEVAVGFTYEAVYTMPASGGDSFGRQGDAAATLRPARVDVTRWARHRDTVGSFDARASLGMGGWALDRQPAYDGERQVLYPAQSPERGSSDVSRMIRSIEDFRGDVLPFDPEDGIYVTTLMVGSDESIYMVVNTAEFAITGVLMRRFPDGRFEHIAGAPLDTDDIYTSPCLLAGECGEGGDAKQAQLLGQTWAIAPDDSIYFTDGSCIRRIRDGVMERVGGNSCGLVEDDDFPTVDDLAFAPNGDMIFASDNALFRLREGERPRRFAGCERCDVEEFDGIRAPSNARIEVDELLVDPSGTVRYFDRSGRLIELRAGELRVVLHEEGADVQRASVGRDGAVYFFEPSPSGNSLLKRFQNDAVQTIAGSNRDLYDPENLYMIERAFTADNIPANSAFVISLSNPAVTSNGDAYFASYAQVDADGTNSSLDPVLKQVRNAFPSSVGDEQALVSSRNARIGYLFGPSGRILEARSLNADVTRLTYEYEGDALVSITDRDGLVTRIERTPEGRLAAIVGPYGHRTEYELDDDGYISRVAYEDGSAVEISSERGLITTWRDAVGRETTYSWATDGGLTRVDDPEGGWKSLTATDSRVVLETSSGRTEVHESNTSQGFMRTSRRTNALGQEWVSSRGFDGVSTMVSPDGTTRSTVLTGDPRFGLQSSYVSLRTTSVPSGLEQRSIRTKEVELDDPLDLNSLATLTETVTVNGAAWTYRWDAAARTFTSTSPEGRVITRTYDEKLRNVSIEQGGFAAVTAEYDDDGRTVRYSAGGVETSATYDERGRVATVTDAFGDDNSYTYDSFDRLLSVTTPEGRIHSLAYDANGFPSEVMPGVGMAYEETYNAYGLRTSLTHPSGDRDDTEWNVDRQIVQASRANGQTVSMTYDELGRVASWTTDRGTFTRTFDPTTSLPVATTSPEGQVTMGYDGFLLDEMEISFEGQSHQIELQHDDNFRLVERTVGGDSVARTYDADGLPTEIGPATYQLRADAPLIEAIELGSLETTYSYDDLGRVESVTYQNGGDVLFAQNYQFEGGARLTGVDETVQGTTTALTYDFDRDGQLIEASRNGSIVATFDYDERGNRTILPAGSATYDSSDRVLTAGARTYQVDESGWVTGWSGSGDAVSLQYDGRDLMRATVGADTISYGYDALGRRIWRKENGTFDRGWLYDQNNRPVAEVDSNGDIRARFVYGMSNFTPDFMIADGTTYQYVRDHVGSIRMVVNAQTGAVEQMLEYDALGRVVSDTNPGFQPFAFAGGIYDSTTGLHRLGARDYDPWTGRWTSADPRMFGGGFNLYVYGFNDPINFVDPDGEFGFAAFADKALGGAVVVGFVGAGALVHAKYRWGKLEHESNRRAQETGGRLGIGRVDAENAMRHCAWQCDMSRAVSSDYAEAIGDYHENPSIPKKVGGGGKQNLPGGPLWNDRLKDEHNNICGRENATREGSCLDLCQADLDAGRLATNVSSTSLQSAPDRNFTPQVFATFP